MADAAQDRCAYCWAPLDIATYRFRGREYCDARCARGDITVAEIGDDPADTSPFDHPSLLEEPRG